MVGQRHREGIALYRCTGRDEFSPDRVTTFAIQRLAGGQVPFGAGDHVSVEPDRCTGGHIAQRGVGHRDVHLETDEVVRAVQSAIPAIRRGAAGEVFEAVGDVPVGRLDDDEDALLGVVFDPVSVPGDAGHHLDAAGVGEYATLVGRATYRRDLLLTAGCKGQTVV